MRSVRSAPFSAYDVVVDCAREGGLTHDAFFMRRRGVRGDVRRRARGEDDVGRVRDDIEPMGVRR